MSSEGRSLVMGRVVDSYTNILTVKLFGRMRDEDAYVREAMDGHYGAMRSHLAMITRFHTCLTVLNALLLVSTAAIGLTLWGQGIDRRGSRRDGVAARVANRDGGGLGELGGHVDLREHRHRARGHAIDRRAASRRRSSRRACRSRSRGARFGSRT